MKRFYFACGGVEADRSDGLASYISMDVSGSRRNIHLKISDITRSMVSRVPDLLLDLLEIAAYVYCGDQRARRGLDTLEDTGSAWRRDLHYVIPVRHPEVWRRPELNETLKQTLDFLSDDFYEFDFRPAARNHPTGTEYFDLVDGGMAAEEVVLFSGGIDSFAGALETIFQQNKKTVLVGHHSAPKVVAAQKELVDALKKAGHGNRTLYISIRVTNADCEPIETTQRSRSFLFACLAFVVARMFDRDHFTFFENGVVSLNLPIARDVVGARATRTTHPRVISGFAELFSILANRPIEVRTPYLWSTKTEIVEKTVAMGFGRLLSKTVSCAHPRQWTKDLRQCGNCSQCIDRRFAVVAAGAEEFDPAGGYDTDLLIGPRMDDADIRMAVAYTKLCLDVRGLDRDGFATKYADVYAAAGEVKGLNSCETVDRFWDLYRRHAVSVLDVVEAGVKLYADKVTTGTLPRGSLLSLFISRMQLDPPSTADTTKQLAEFMGRLQKPICDFAVDETMELILFRTLLDNHRAAKAVMADVPYMPSADLAAKLSIDEPTLRKSVSRLRERAIPRLTVDQGLVFDPKGFIQNSRIDGYRIDPELREISRADIAAADHLSHSPASNVTNGNRTD